MDKISIKDKTIKISIFRIIKEKLIHNLLLDLHKNKDTDYNITVMRDTNNRINKVTFGNLLEGKIRHKFNIRHYLLRKY